jgi:hypothetical protein
LTDHLLDSPSGKTGRKSASAIARPQPFAPFKAANLKLIALIAKSFHTHKTAGRLLNLTSCIERAAIRSLSMRCLTNGVCEIRFAYFFDVLLDQWAVAGHCMWDHHVSLNLIDRFAFRFH